MVRGAISWTRWVLVLAPFMAACSGGQSNPETPTGGETTGGETTASTEETSVSTPPPASTGDSGGAGGLNAAQREQIEVVLKRAARNAETCTGSVPDGKGGKGEIKVLLDGQKSRITEVTVGAPWGGTAMEACIKRAFQAEIILPFDGDPLEVPYDLDIPVKAAPADPKKPGKK
ncbi:MAG: hypothetical protein IPK82_13235 [Polyangiaceae bacterium]|nr:hypothetical protein [Polyangiaceae bacterium]